MIHAVTPHPPTEQSLRVEAPALDGLVVSLPPPRPVADVDLIARLGELRFLYAERTARADGEELAEGDEVVADFLGRCGGRLLPFSAREGEVLWVHSPDAMGLALRGFRVGERAHLDREVPQDYPISSLRGRTATFEVDVRSAAHVDLPDPSDPAVLRQMGLGDSIQEALASLHSMLTEERVAQVRAEATRRALELLTERANVNVPDGLVEFEIGVAWHASEGAFLARVASTDDRDDALRAWVRDPDIRERTRARIATTLVVRAIAEREKLFPTEAQMEAQLAGLARSMGLSKGKAVLGKRDDPLQILTAREQLTHLAVVDHVMKLVTLRFDR